MSISPYYIPIKPPDAPRTPTPTQQPRTAAPVAGVPKLSFLDLLNQDPRVVAARFYEKQGLADIASMPGPRMRGSGFDSASYDVQLRHLMEEKPIQLERLAYTFGLNKGNLEHANLQAKAQIINSLAARGMLRSGAKGSLQTEQARGYGQALTDLTTKRGWAEADIERNIRQQTETIAAARASAQAAANAAYADAQADYARGVLIDKRELRNKLVDAYIEAYQDYISDPSKYFGAAPDFDPSKFL